MASNATGSLSSFRVFVVSGPILPKVGLRAPGSSVSDSCCSTKDFTVEELVKSTASAPSLRKRSAEASWLRSVLLV